MKEEQFFEAFSRIDSQYIEDAKLPLLKRRRAWAWKKLITVVAVLLLVVSATLSLMKYPNEHYYITMENGEYYLKLKEPHYKDEHNMCGYVYHVSFASVQEMFDDFTTGNFTQTELEHMQAMEPNEAGKLGIPNLNRLCEPILPEDVSWNGRVYWYGFSNYSFSTSCKTYQMLRFNTITKAYYEEIAASVTNFQPPDPDAKVSVEYVDDRNAIIYHVEYSTGFIDHYMYYTISSGDKQIIVEEFPDESDTDSTKAMCIYIKDGDCYGSVSFYYKTNRPSVEWLSSFGLKEIE